MWHFSSKEPRQDVLTFAGSIGLPLTLCRPRQFYGLGVSTSLSRSIVRLDELLAVELSERLSRYAAHSGTARAIVAKMHF